MAPKQLLSGRAGPGDFVVVVVEEKPHLGEVVEVHKSKYGYESYRVLYLAEKPYSVDEDWVAKGMATPLKVDDLKATLESSYPNVAEKFPQDKVAAAMREAVTHAWHIGLRPHTERQLLAAKNAPRIVPSGLTPAGPPASAHATDHTEK